MSYLFGNSALKLNSRWVVSLNLTARKVPRSNVRHLSTPSRVEFRRNFRFASIWGSRPTVRAHKSNFHDPELGSGHKSNKSCCILKSLMIRRAVPNYKMWNQQRTVHALTFSRPPPEVLIARARKRDQREVARLRFSAARRTEQKAKRDEAQPPNNERK